MNELFQHIRSGKSFQWTCPHCQTRQIVTKENSNAGFSFLSIGATRDGYVQLAFLAIRCLDVECNNLTLEAFLHKHATDRLGNSILGQTIHRWPLLPDSAAKPQPDYIPAPIREDYLEACAIRDRSPKASATLARRCLQGMIRHFCDVKGRTLDWEIKELRRRVEAHEAPRSVTLESVEAIDHVRKVGNIGAHMEKDIDLIVDVDPGEAQALIELIELLFQEWYVEQHNRQIRLDRVKQIREQKDAIIEAGKPNSLDEAVSAIPSG